ncbi:hypothetical protein ACFVW8_11625 [Streptomyces sp. NPDC058221]|uniref:hypothetical protein n=1 Tax=Streptomyces sp. NPDC058221 TaxID=3346388 RepID=UPI0036E14A2E
MIGVGYRQRHAAAAAALSLLVVLAGCGTDSEDDGSARGAEPSSSGPAATRSPHTTKEAAASSPAPSSKPSVTDTAAADGTDVGACADGRCEIAVSKATPIDVDPRFGVTGVSVARVAAHSVTLEATGKGGSFMSTEIGPGGSGGLNKLGFRLKSLVKGTAVLVFYPEK